MVAIVRKLQIDGAGTRGVLLTFFVLLCAISGYGCDPTERAETSCSLPRLRSTLIAITTIVESGFDRADAAAIAELASQLGPGDGMEVRYQKIGYHGETISGILIEIEIASADSADIYVHHAGGRGLVKAIQTALDAAR